MRVPKISQRRIAADNPPVEEGFPSYIIGLGSFNDEGGKESLIENTFLYLMRQD